MMMVSRSIDFDDCSNVHEVGCWMEDSIPLDPCSMFPIDLGGYGSSCIVGAKESF